MHVLEVKVLKPPKRGEIILERVLSPLALPLSKITQMCGQKTVRPKEESHLKYA